MPSDIKQYYSIFLNRWIIVVLLSVLISIVGLNSFIQYPRGLIQDDTFYYTQIGYNLGTIHSTTFDGINITSGYHLLWGWFLGFVSMILSLFTLNKDIHLIGMVTAYFVLCFSISFFFGKNNLEKVFLFFSTLLCTVLMETLSLSLFLLILSRQFLKEDNEGINSLTIMSLLLIPLIRIDASVVPFFLSLYYLLKRKKIFLQTNAFLIVGISLHFFLCSSYFIILPLFLHWPKPNIQ